MASAQKWDRFEKKFAVLRRKHGFTVFHTRKFKNRDGDFKGWRQEKQSALLDDLDRIADRGCMTGVTVTLNNAEYERDFKRTPDVPRKLQLATKYGLCFEASLLYFVAEAQKRKFQGKLPKLFVICESGATNAGDAVRIFNEHKTRLESERLPILGALSFDKKDSTPALMLADFFAHTRWLREFKGVPLTAEDLAPADAKATLVASLTVGEGGLAQHKRRLIEQFNEHAKIKASLHVPRGERSSAGAKD